MRIFIFIFAFVSISCNAAVWKDSPYVYIETIYPHDGGLIIYTSYSDDKVSSCDKGKRFGIEIDNPNYEVKSSILITAFTTNKKVKLRYDSSQNKKCTAIINRFLVEN